MSTAQVINENGHQIIRLPDEFHLEGNEVSVKRVGRSLLLIPAGADAWEMFTGSLSQFTDDFMRDRAQPAEQDRPNMSE